jgi:hypothetical protein
VGPTGASGKVYKIVPVEEDIYDDDDDDDDDDH